MTTIPQETKQLGAEFWNSNPCGGAWPTYREFFEWYQRTEPYIYRVLDQHDWQGRTVLEVGCGQGTVLNYLPGKGALVHGIDMSADSIAQAEAGALELGHRDRVTCRVADAEALPFDDNSFERIVSIGVLHHTPDTAKAVREVYRTLSPGGTAIVMLYRKGNPKWWATVSLRAASKLLDRFRGRSGVLVGRLREDTEEGSAQGTALLELFGVPVLNAFSNRESRAMFAQFSEVRITNHQPGFERLCDILPWLGAARAPLALIDRLTYRVWGFYQVIEARK
jgi:SAM-dependent methyltransferase